MKLIDQEWLGVILEDDDNKHQGRYKVHIPQLQPHMSKDTGIWAKNHVTNYRISPSEDGVYGSYFPLHPNTQVIVKFFTNQFESAYIDRITSDHNPESMPYEIIDRDDYYQIIRTPKNNHLIALCEETETGGAADTPNSIHIYYNDKTITIVMDSTGLNINVAKVEPEEGEEEDDESGNINLKTEASTFIQVDEDLHIKVTGTVYIQSETDINILASENINVESENANINILASENINIQSDSDLNIKASGNVNIQSESDMNINSGGLCNIEAESDVNILATGNCNIESTSTTSIRAAGLCNIDGAMVNLNCGGAQSAEGADEAEDAEPAEPAEDYTEPNLIDTDSEFEYYEGSDGTVII